MYQTEENLLKECEQVWESIRSSIEKDTPYNDNGGDRDVSLNDDVWRCCCTWLKWLVKKANFKFKI